MVGRFFLTREMPRPHDLNQRHQEPMNLTYTKAQRGIRTREGEPRTIATLIGNTPLLRLELLEPHSGVEVYAKVEWVNPGGSVKDRAALRMIEEGERSGALAPGKTLIDASSGNTGISYALLGAAFGYPVQIVVPANITPSRLRLLQAYGADIVTTDPQEGIDGAIETARMLVQESPDQYFYPDQYNNSANWRAHYLGTGTEIFTQTAGRVTHFVAGLGTTGTFVGTARRLRASKPDVTLVAFQPDSPLHALEGLKHLPSTAFVPGIFDPNLADKMEIVSTEEARAMAFHLRDDAGILVGPSAAAAAVVVDRIARSVDSGVVVTVFPDAGDKYLEEPFWKS